MDCDLANKFVSIYLFRNGLACKPEKLRVRRCEYEKYFHKGGSAYFYNGKT